MSAISNYDNGHMYMPGNSSQKIHRPILPAPNPASFAVKSPEFNSSKSPFRTAGNEQKCRQKKRSDSKKKRDLAFWRRVYESGLLSEDNKQLVYLKIITGLSWKETQRRFNEGKPFQMQQAALQMRLNRLAEKMDVSSPNSTGFFFTSKVKAEVDKMTQSLWAQEQEPNPQTSGPSNFPVLSSTLIQPTSWPMESVNPRDNFGYCKSTLTTNFPLHMENSWSGIDRNYAYTNSITSPTIMVSNTLGYNYCPDQFFDQSNSYSADVLQFIPWKIDS